MPRTQEQLNEYKRNKRKTQREHIQFLEINDSSNPEIAQYHSERSNRNSQTRAVRKTWPSQSKEVRSEAGRKKLDRIREIESVNPNDPEVMLYRTKQKSRVDRYKSRNPEKVKISNKKSKAKHREANNRKSREKHALNPEIHRTKQKTWRVNNLDKTAAGRRRWLNKNPEAKIANILRSRLNSVIRGKTKKTVSALKLLGCSLSYLMKHIEKQFKPDMTWENYGLKTWHIDHIDPCSWFDMADPDQQRMCFHYTNLQPMFAKENIAKSNKFPHTIRESCEAQPQFA